MLDLFPEWECLVHGDPFIAEIVKADDIIDDHRSHWQLLGITEEKAADVVKLVEAERLKFEVTTLNRWYALKRPAQ